MATYNPQYIKHAISKMFEPGDVVEVRITDPKNKACSGYFNDFDKLADAIASKSGEVEAVYVTLNPVNPALRARANNWLKPYAKTTTQDQDILRRRYLFIDVDPQRPAGISSTNEEKALAKELHAAVHTWLTELGWPEPLVADSGNGYHLLYRIDLPNTNESRELVESCLLALDAKFSTDKVKVDTSVFNAARIIKAYGSLAAKGDSTEDRPHRIAKMPTNAQYTGEIVTLEQLTALAAMSPATNKGKNKSGRATQGSWTPELVSQALTDANIEHGAGLPYNGGTKYQHDCLNNGDHQKPDAYTFVDKDGWVTYFCSHNSCGGLNTKEWVDEMEKRAGHKIGKPTIVDIMRGFDCDFDDVEAQESSPKTELPDALPAQTTQVPVGTKIAHDVREKVDEIMRAPEKPIKDIPWYPRREKHRMVCSLIVSHMRNAGTFWSTGAGVVYVPNSSRENLLVTSPEFLHYLVQFGVLPGDPVAAQITKYLSSMVCDRNIILLMSYYDRETHTLYVNEYAGNFLKITSEGVTRMRNGDEGILFDHGVRKCDPLVCDIDNMQPIPALEPKGLIHTHILDTINYADDGLGKSSAQLLLLTSILSLYFTERLKATPFVAFTGVTGSMKSALVTCVGRLIQGNKFAMFDTPEGRTGIQELKDKAINYPFIGLDEANRLKELSNILKVIATGGTDTRRVLYTTSTMQESPYQARMWLTMNTGDPAEESVANRMLIVDAAAREEKNPYRATYYLNWTDELRNTIWTELVSRLYSAMKELKMADETGRGNLTVSHRMSDYFVFGLSMAMVEGTEAAFRTSMVRLEGRQENSVVDSCEIIDLIAKVPASYNNRSMTAKEWGGIFANIAGYDDSVLRRQISNKNAVARYFKGNIKLLEKRFGLVAKKDRHLNTTYYTFTKLTYCETLPDVEAM